MITKGAIVPILDACSSELRNAQHISGKSRSVGTNRPSRQALGVAKSSLPQKEPGIAKTRSICRFVDF